MYLARCLGMSSSNIAQQASLTTRASVWFNALPITTRYRPRSSPFLSVCEAQTDWALCCGHLLICWPLCRAVFLLCVGVYAVSLLTGFDDLALVRHPPASHQSQHNIPATLEQKSLAQLQRLQHCAGTTSTWLASSCGGSCVWPGCVCSLCSNGGKAVYAFGAVQRHWQLVD